MLALRTVARSVSKISTPQISRAFSQQASPVSIKQTQESFNSIYFFINFHILLCSINMVITEAMLNN